MKVDRRQITQVELCETLEEVSRQIARRIEKHGLGVFVSRAEAVGTLVEEYHELVEAMRGNDLRSFLDECMDVLVVCFWAEVSLRHDVERRGASGRIGEIRNALEGGK